MSALSEIKDRLNARFGSVFNILKVKILGPNNERLDFLMDSFYKLTPSQRNGVLAGVIGIIISFVLSAVFLYFGRVRSLEEEMSDVFAALHELKVQRDEDAIEGKKFEQLAESVKRKTKALNFKPFFEKLSREHKVTILDVNEKQVDMDANNPLSETFKEAQVEMKLPKISIPKLLTFLVDIEKSDHYLRIMDLKITGQYGNKLYFDVVVIIHGYLAKNSSGGK